LNLLCAAAALKLLSKYTASEPLPTPLNASGSLMMLFGTGLLGIGYEVLVVRVLSQVAENTVYTFAMLLAVYLVGTVLGAAAYQRWSSSQDVENGLRERLLWMLAAACLLGIMSLWCAETLKALVLRTLGPSMGAALAAEGVLAVAAFMLPTLLMGAVFSHIAMTVRGAGISFGLALGANTVGAAIAPFLFGALLSSLLGFKSALLLVPTGYLALSLRRARFAPEKWVTAVATLALAAWAPSLAMVDIPEGGRLLSYAEGAMATVSVVEDHSGVMRLHINNRQQEGSSASLRADARQALLPILLHPSPRRALFLGLGTGVTASSAAEDAMLLVDAVELLPEVIDASTIFRRMFGDGAPNPRLHVITADARRFVRATRQRYDVIVSDNFHPARSGSGSLYTAEHFKAVRDRLGPGGLFCQWLPLHQLDLETLRSIVRTFITVYPVGWAMLATNSLDTPVLGLVALRESDRFDVGQLRERVANLATSRSPAEFGIDDDLALLGSFVAGPRALTHFAADAPLNTDDHPVVAYYAPRSTYVPDSLPRDRLIALLREFELSPDELVAASAEPAWRRRLAAYWAARNRFIQAGRDVQPTSDLRNMLAQVREPLLSVLRISADFRPAYDPLLRMGAELGHIDASAARTLLTELHQAQPSRPEAAQALRELSDASP
jgi:spermidine synthase